MNEWMFKQKITEHENWKTRFTRFTIKLNEITYNTYINMIKIDLINTHVTFHLKTYTINVF